MRCTTAVSDFFLSVTPGGGSPTVKRKLSPTHPAPQSLLAHMGLLAKGGSNTYRSLFAQYMWGDITLNPGATFAYPGGRT